jgi:hypothetical protein
MPEELISVIHAANQLGKHKQTVFKVLRRLEIQPAKRRDPSKRNQLVSYINKEEFERVRREIEAMPVSQAAPRRDAPESDDFVSVEIGLFYLIQLEPSHDPGRFKVGFAASMSERLRTLRCSAPFLELRRTWRCRRRWEKTAIDCVTADCEQLHTEVFRTNSLDRVISRCEQFFELMPTGILQEADSEPTELGDRA